MKSICIGRLKFIERLKAAARSRQFSQLLSTSYRLISVQHTIRLIVLAVLVLGPKANVYAGVYADSLQTMARGALLSVEEIGSLTRDQVAERLHKERVPGIPRFGVNLYRVVYRTVDYDGTPSIASGAIALPTGSTEPAPLLSFQHGTVVARYRVPSQYGFDLVSMGLAASGYATVLPDYLGLGESEGLHPYVHASSLGSAVVDILRAARRFCEDAGFVLDEQLFLMGYSEGGYATMAAHRDIEELHADEFAVTASAPMAGPYSLSVVMVEQILSDQAYPSPGYLPYTLLAYDMIYDLFDDVEEVFETPYAGQVTSLFDGSKAFRYINKELPDIPFQMLKADFLKAFREDAHHPLRLALKENDVYNWSPKAPMRLFHCVGDDQVAFKNAELALRAFQTHGAHHVELAELNFGDHEACAPPAIFLGKLWFDEFKEKSSPAPLQANVKIIKAGAFD